MLLYFLKRNRSEKEVRAAALVLQTIWGYKELRKPLEKEGWKKSDFQVQLLLRPRLFYLFSLDPG
jgi:catenin (cadherin-associated protein) delta 1